LSGSVVYNQFKTDFDNYTASLNTYTQSLDFSVDSSSLATTGSNTFRGNQSVVGNVYVGSSLVVTSSLIAKDSFEASGSISISGSLQFTGSITNTGGTFTQNDDLLVNGDLTVNSGVLSANNGLSVTLNITANNDVIVDGNLSLLSQSPGQGIISASSLYLSGDSISQTSEYKLTINGGVNIIGTAETSSFLITTGSVAPVGGPTLPPYAGYVTLPHVLHSLDFTDDTEASASGVPLGGVYRNGNFLMIRVV
jgi:hypothetical protein